MPAKRIIPCLDIDQGRTVKGIKFEGLVDIGDPITLAQRYEYEGADELIFLDITAHSNTRPLLYSLISRLAEELTIPFIVGGGIRTLDDAQRLLDAGADKVTVNSAALEAPSLITEISRRFGRQSVCLAVDSRRIGADDVVFSSGGKKPTKWKTLEWLVEGCTRGAGEILLTCIDSDGTCKGYNLPLLRAARAVVDVPVIASGGAGALEDFVNLFTFAPVEGALAAGVFHSQRLSIGAVKDYLAVRGIEVRNDPLKTAQKQ